MTTTAEKAPKAAQMQAEGFGGRYYHIVTSRKREYVFPSVTNIIDTTTPKTLHYWSAEEERKSLIDAAVVAASLTGDISTTDGDEIDDIVRKEIDGIMAEQYGRYKSGKRKGQPRFAFEARKREAANIGTRLHKMTELWMKAEIETQWGFDLTPGRKLKSALQEMEQSNDEPVLVAWMAFQDWVKEVNFRPIVTEVPLWNRKHKYAGMLDWSGWMDLPGVQNVLAFGDTKTSKALYGQERMQVAAHRGSAAVMPPEDLPQGLRRTMMKDLAFEGFDKTWTCVLRLPKNIDDPAFEVVVMNPKETQEHMDAFRHSIGLFNWHQKLKAAGA